jgi:hypothetical protein
MDSVPEDGDCEPPGIVWGGFEVEFGKPLEAVDGIYRISIVAAGECPMSC